MTIFGHFNLHFVEIVIIVVLKPFMKYCCERRRIFICQLKIILQHVITVTASLSWLHVTLSLEINSFKPDV